MFGGEAAAPFVVSQRRSVGVRQLHGRAASAVEAQEASGQGLSAEGLEALRRKRCFLAPPFSSLRLPARRLGAEAKFESRGLREDRRQLRWAKALPLLETPEFACNPQLSAPSPSRGREESANLPSFVSASEAPLQKPYPLPRSPFRCSVRALPAQRLLVLGYLLVAERKGNADSGLWVAFTTRLAELLRSLNEERRRGCQRSGVLSLEQITQLLKCLARQRLFQVLLANSETPCGVDDHPAALPEEARPWPASSPPLVCQPREGLSVEGLCGGDSFQRRESQTQDKASSSDDTWRLRGSAVFPSEFYYLVNPSPETPLEASIDSPCEEGTARVPQGQFDSKPWEATLVEASVAGSSFLCLKRRDVECLAASLLRELLLLFHDRLRLAVEEGKQASDSLGDDQVWSRALPRLALHCAVLFAPWSGGDEGGEKAALFALVEKQVAVLQRLLGHLLLRAQRRFNAR